jgi:hypothetical protein
MASSLTTAVHESVHRLDWDRRTFATLTAGQVPMLKMRGYFAPADIVPSLPDRSDEFAQIYLLGKASSKDMLVALLDELNAYTRGLATAVALRHFYPTNRRTGMRDGLAATMMFLNLYVKHAKEKEPNTWRQLLSGQANAVIRTLWDQAERTLETACPISLIGFGDGKYLRQIYGVPATTALGEVLGRAVTAPRACEPRLDARREAAELQGWTSGESKVHSFTTTVNED